jgi:hypothetical protein
MIQIFYNDTEENLLSKKNIGFYLEISKIIFTFVLQLIQ